MIDSHCHLNYKDYENDLEKVIERAVNGGVEKIISVGTSLEASRKAVELAKIYDEVYAVVGAHPHEADKLKNGWEEQLEALMDKPKVIGVGEIGLDYFNNKIDPKIQKEVFIKQIKLAFKHKLPLQIHNRHAGDDIIEVLSNHASYLLNPPGVFHCMSGDVLLLGKVLALGFFIGFDGNLTYKGIAKGETTALSELVKNTPLERILIETDAPFLSPEPYRGSRNEPSYAIIVGNSVSQIKGIPLDKVDKVTTENVKKIFNI